MTNNLKLQSQAETTHQGDDTVQHDVTLQQVQRGHEGLA